MYWETAVALAEGANGPGEGSRDGMGLQTHPRPRRKVLHGLSMTMIVLVSSSSLVRHRCGWSRGDWTHEKALVVHEADCRDEEDGDLTLSMSSLQTRGKRMMTAAEELAMEDKTKGQKKRGE